MDTPNEQELVEALAPFQPRNLDAQTWQRFREDAVALVSQLPLPNIYQGTWHLSVLAQMLADLAPVRPNATLAELLTIEDVTGYLARCRASGMPAGSLKVRRIGLNRLLRAQAGVPARRRRRPVEPRRIPAPADELVDQIRVAADSSDAGATSFLRVVAVTMAGHKVPTRHSSTEVPINVRRGRVYVGEGDGVSSWRPPFDLPEAVSGSLDRHGTEAARRWLRREFDGSLHLGRLQVTAPALRVGTEPAVVLMRVPGFGRDRLTAAAAAAVRPDPAVVCQMLRGERGAYGPG